MVSSPVDIIIFAPLAPIFGVLLLWFIQLLFIEGQKFLLSKIKKSHPAFCRFTNFIGILFQSICHAMGFTVTRHGVSEFKVTVHYGSVKPKKKKKGIFEWTANVFLFIGPFFIPALLLLSLFLLIKGIPELTISIQYGFAECVINFFSNVYILLKQFFTLLVSIDLLHPVELGFFIVLIFLGLGIRPSYIGEDKRRKVDMMYDLKNIWEHVTHKPVYILLLILLSYVISYVSVLTKTSIYITLFSIFGWLSIISIVALFIAQLITVFIKNMDELPGIWKVFPYITIPASYILARSIFYFYLPDVGYYKTASVVIMVLSTAIVTFILLKFKTNKFKTQISMKKLRKKGKDGTR